VSTDAYARAYFMRILPRTYGGLNWFESRNISETAVHYIWSAGCQLILLASFLLGAIGNFAAVLGTIVKIGIQAPGRIHGRQPLSLQQRRSYFPGFWGPGMRCGLGEFERGLGGFAPFPLLELVPSHRASQTS